MDLQRMGMFDVKDTKKKLNAIRTMQVIKIDFNSIRNTREHSK